MKKVIALVMALSLAASPVFAAPLLISPASVDIAAEKAQPTEPTAEDLERLLKIVRPLIYVPEECTVFDWYYNTPNYYNQGYWSLSWHDTGYNKSVSASCDPDGHVLSYGCDDYSKPRSSALVLPKYTKDSLEDAACQKLAALCPEAASHMKLTSSECGSRYLNYYTYYFTRYENGVIVPDNTASVSLDYTDGHLVQMQCNYDYGMSFSDTAALAEADAKNALAEKQTMKLSYQLKTERDDEYRVISRKAYLVYRPELSYLSVDAVTGDVYTERNTWNVRTMEDYAGGMNTATAEFASMKMYADEAVAEEGYQLSEEELAALDTLNTLISKEDAIRAVTENAALYIDPDATAVSANLTKQTASYYDRPANDTAEPRYVWSLSFSAPYRTSSAENGYYTPYMSATVDASSGAVLSFRSSVPGFDYYVNDARTLDLPVRTYTKEQASELFSAFAAVQLPAYVPLTRLAEATDTIVLDYENREKWENPTYRCANIRLVRVNEGVDFPYNAINGTVDLVTGKIVSFSYTWYDDVTFESPAAVITPEEAYRALLDADGFGLNYEINSNYTYKQYQQDANKGYVDYSTLYETERYTRLVYSGYRWNTTSVSALTGELLDASGDVYAPADAHEYDDISGHWAEADIRMLADLGVGFPGKSFRPDDPITPDDFRLLAGYFTYIEEDEVPENAAFLTRTKAVKLLIRAAGFEKIAAMPDIFITDFADNSDLVREDVGAIAIARGFGFIEGDMGVFRPYDTLTRAEAARLLLRYVQTEF